MRSRLSFLCLLALCCLLALPAAAQTGGTVWAWGDNEDGELGNGTFAGVSGTYNNACIATPGQASGVSGVVAIAGGDVHSLALKSDGTVWAWGENYKGQLGNSTFTGSPNSPNGTENATPGQVVGLSDIIAIAVGSVHSLALKSDGTIWAWGYNDFGELGNGSFSGTTDYSIATPGQVIGLSNVVAIAGGGLFSLAIVAKPTLPHHPVHGVPFPGGQKAPLP